MLQNTFNLENDILIFINSFYDPESNIIKLKFYNTRNNKLYVIEDRSGFKPFTYVKSEQVDLDILDKFVNDPTNKGKYDLQTMQVFDGIRNKEIEVFKFMSGSVYNIYKKITTPLKLDSQYEQNIRIHESYLLSNQLVPSSLYQFKNNTVYLLEPELDDKKKITLDRMIKSVKDESNQTYIDYLKFYTNLLSQDVPFIRRCAIDIEVKNKPDEFPSLDLHDDPIIACSFYSNDGFKKVYAIAELWDGCDLDEGIELVENEQELILKIFELLNEYPMIITFNGDGFDLAYITQRSKSFSDIDQTKNPIVYDHDEAKRNNTDYAGDGFLREPCKLVNGIHLDLYRLFRNVSLHTYGFNRKYATFGLDAISKALLKEGKIETSKDKTRLAEIPLNELCRYCLKDSELTLRLTTYSQDLVMKLLFSVSRITKATIEDIDRYGISNWSRSMMYFEHRKQNMLIPNKTELALKGEGSTHAIISGKKFQGGFVMQPTAGTYFDVTCFDFASLYPSIIKMYNMSYETINCGHLDCREKNKIPETTHYYCDKRQGTLSLIIGVIRDLRVNYFKRLSKDKTLSQDELELYDAITQSSKVILNGAYGVIGSTSFNLFCLPVAESVTALGRNIIKKTMEYAESLGVKILYGDTDSVFAHKPNQEQIEKIIEFTKDNFNIDLEVDKKFRYVIFSQRKKNYFGVHEDGKLELKGLTGKKSNIPRYVKNCFYEMGEILKNVKNEQDLELRINDVKKLINKYVVNLKNQDYNLADLQFNIMLKDDIDSYGKVTNTTNNLMGETIEIKNGIPAHIKIAKELRDMGETIEINTYISFIKCKSGAKLLQKTSKSDVDVKKYIDTMESTMEPICETLGINFQEAIKPTSKQMTFQSLFFK